MVKKITYIILQLPEFKSLFFTNDKYITNNHGKHTVEMKYFFQKSTKFAVV